jgi:hypothetical protein
MKNASLFSILIILSLFFVPTQALQAGLVPVEKASTQTKKLKNKFLRKKNRKTKFQLKKQKKTYSTKSQQKSNYMGFLTVALILLAFYLIIAIALLVLGFIFALPALWVTGILLIGIPLTIFIIIFISDTIAAAQYAKEEKIRQENQQ